MKKSNKYTADQIHQRRKLKDFIKANASHYERLKKSRKSALIESAIEIYGAGLMNRDSISRAFRRCLVYEQKMDSGLSNVVAFKGVRGRPPEYQDDDVIYWIQQLWVVMGRVHEGLMKAELPQWLRHIGPNGGPKIETRVKLLKMSISTMERHLSSYKKQDLKSHLSATRRAFKGVSSLIPQRPLNFKINCSGYIEADTVAHCGPKLSGSHAWTLNTVDHHTHWCEQQAVMGKTAEAILQATIVLRERIPFKVKGCHHDGGTEFNNSALYEYFKDPENFALQTCGRAYRKNDQARVEQRNWTHVRQVFGYERIDTEELLGLMNDMYANELRLLGNFFTATQKLKTKTRKGSRYHRKFETPQTPYHRVMADKTVSEVEKEKLKAFYETLNPFELRKSLDKKLRHFEKRLNETLNLSEITKEPSVGSPEEEAA